MTLYLSMARRCPYRARVAALASIAKRAAKDGANVARIAKTAEPLCNDCLRGM
jgi:hypothetical protein